ncbi:MAG: FAD:protein FMN transferase, partial [Eubacterium sp.]|nr:FAD:protein FMN transferase [Eubacterium sp.]
MDIKNAKTKIIIALFALCALVLTSCSAKSAEPYTGQSFFFDTVCSITVYGMDEADAKAAVDAAFDECGKLEGILSKTIEGSDIYNINHSGTEGAEVSDQTLELIRSAIAYGDESGGSFDCTIGPAEALYDFHEEEHQVPTEEQLADAVEKVDYKQISIDGSKVTLGIPGAEIDLGGIGKGYAADIAADCLAEHGVTSG